MPPTYNISLSTQSHANSSRFAFSTNELRQQWVNPKDVMSILLLLGGDIVNRALAQLAGGILTPVAFSFGWVSYAVTTLLASVGDARLMPSGKEGPCVVVTAKSGYVRSNYSWVIDRIIRDYEAWMDPAVQERLEKMLDERHDYMRKNIAQGSSVPRPSQTGLCVSVYEPSSVRSAGQPTHDLIYWSGLLIAVVQLIVAAVPVFTFGDWGILLITLCGIVLALITGAFPQWKHEKWPCRRGSHNTYILTRGNGAQHAIVILGNGKGLNLEDLATDGQLKAPSFKLVTRIGLAVVSILWIGLLIAAAGLSTNTWFLLLVGGLGMLQNVLVAGWRIDPSALGVHLDFRGVVGEMTTMDSLLALERSYTTVGRSLLPIFFPGKIWPDEMAKWDELEVQAKEEHARLQKQGKAERPVLEGWVAHAKTFENN